MNRKTHFVFSILIALSVCVLSAAPKEKEKAPAPQKALIDISSLEPLQITGEDVGMIVEKNVDKEPDSKGILFYRKLVLPDFQNGIYYRPYSNPSKGLTGNRISGLAFSSISGLANYETTMTNRGQDNMEQGQFILLQISADKYLAIMPTVSPQALSYLFVQGDTLILENGSFGSDTVKGDIPLLVWAYGKSPYEATSKGWQKVFSSNIVSGDTRINKAYPEMYDYLGWCSWEHYKQGINEANMTEAIHTIEDSGAPIRWVIIDDGYLHQRSRRLLSFPPDKKKFPNGWKPLTSLKSPDKIKWMGIWRNFLGYMEGVSPKHEMDAIKQYLVLNKRESCELPDGSPEAAKAFFDTMTLDAKNSGFDFTKVDFQSKAFFLYHGMANAVSAMRANNEALEAACKEHNIPLLNCIAQSHVNSFNFKHSVLLRVGKDYHKTSAKINKTNTYQSFANNMWVGQTAWGDFDMFHSHAEDAHVMALARAISGGPIYVSDEPSKIVPDVLKKLCLEDGKLLRTEAPGTLLPESFFIHPYREKKPVRVVAPLANKVAAIGFFNLTEKNADVDGFVSAADYPFAGEQLQPYAGPWALPEEGLVVYDPEKMTAKVLADTESYTIPNYQGKLLQLHPRTRGWAVIGRTDKYLPAAAVENVKATKNRISFTLLEAGPFAVWSDKGAPKMKGASFQALGDHLYLADLPVEAGAREVTVTR